MRTVFIFNAHGVHFNVSKIYNLIDSARQKKLHRIRDAADKVCSFFGILRAMQQVLAYSPFHFYSLSSRHIVEEVFIFENHVKRCRIQILHLPWRAVWFLQTLPTYQEKAPWEGCSKHDAALPPSPRSIQSKVIADDFRISDVNSSIRSAYYESLRSVSSFHTGWTFVVFLTKFARNEINCPFLLAPTACTCHYQ